MGTASTAETIPKELDGSYDYGYDDGEEEHDVSPLATFCLICLIIAAVIVLAAAISLHFLLLHLNFRDGLPILIPAYFLYLCFEYFHYQCYYKADMAEKEAEKDFDD
ncbi:MAG: hypothetical protein PHZ04_01345 [Patescibacteria group bacterium]|nr:hypothetical protein [Patescibacteria group bacterium]MDD5294466.1 hypothetical protein [Patescibacteria group bacterium]MDD5554377.1 hypothetical protein [Patescibacteria group bacterium]